MKPSSTPQVSTPEHVRAVVHRLFGAVEHTDPVAYFDRTYHPDVIIHEAPSLSYGGDYCGLEGALEHARAFLATWAPHQGPDDRAMDATVDAVPDHAYVRWNLRVAGRAFPFMSHYRLSDGLIVEARMFAFDSAELIAWHRKLQASENQPGESQAVPRTSAPSPGQASLGPA